VPLRARRRQGTFDSFKTYSRPRRGSNANSLGMLAISRRRGAGQGNVGNGLRRAFWRNAAELLQRADTLHGRNAVLGIECRADAGRTAARILQPVNKVTAGAADHA
jgi:hypothetical protein